MASVNKICRSRRLWRTVHIIRLLSLFILFAPLFGRSKIAFEATGSCNTHSFKNSGEEALSVAYTFRVKVIDAAWSIRVDDLASAEGKRKSYDYTEIVFDGNDLFTVVHYPDRVRTNSVASLALATYGKVAPIKFPIEASPVEKLLWLLFCSSDYEPWTSSNFPPIDLSLLPTNLVDVVAEYFPSIPRFPQKLEAKARGVVVYTGNTAINSLHASTMSILQPQGTFREGFLAFVFQVTESSSFKSEIHFPSRAEASYYSLNPREREWTRFLSTHTIIEVRTLSTSPLPFGLPELPGTAAIIDARFRDGSGRPYRYIETNGTWVGRSDPSAQSVLAGKAIIPIEKRLPTTTSSRLAWLVVVVILAPAPFLFFQFMKYRRATRN